MKAMKGAKAAKKPMKAKAMKAKPMKVVKKKAMKAKAVSNIAKGARAKSAVFAGGKERTVGGVRKDDLVRNKDGRVVYKKRSARAKRAWASSKLKAWVEASKKARKALGITGFVPVGGKTAAGKALHAKIKSLL